MLKAHVTTGPTRCYELSVGKFCSKPPEILRATCVACRKFHAADPTVACCRAHRRLLFMSKTFYDLCNFLLLIHCPWVISSPFRKKGDLTATHDHLMGKVRSSWRVCVHCMTIVKAV